VIDSRDRIHRRRALLAQAPVTRAGGVLEGGRDREVVDTSAKLIVGAAARMLAPLRVFEQTEYLRNQRPRSDAIHRRAGVEFGLGRRASDARTVGVGTGAKRHDVPARRTNQITARRVSSWSVHLAMSSTLRNRIAITRTTGRPAAFAATASATAYPGGAGHTLAVADAKDRGGRGRAAASAPCEPAHLGGVPRSGTRGRRRGIIDRFLLLTKYVPGSSRPIPDDDEYLSPRTARVASSDVPQPIKDAPRSVGDGASSGPAHSRRGLLRVDQTEQRISAWHARARQPHAVPTDSLASSNRL